MTAPSVAEVMRSVSSRAPSIRCVGASDEMIQLSTTEPMVEPMKPPMVAALTPRIAPPIEPPIAAPAAPRMRVAMGPHGARVKRRRRQRPVRGVLRRAEGVQTRATPSPPAVPATRVMRWLWAATARRPQRRPRTAFDDGGRAGRCGDLRTNANLIAAASIADVRWAVRSAVNAAMRQSAPSPFLPFRPRVMRLLLCRRPAFRARGHTGRP